MQVVAFRKRLMKIYIYGGANLTQKAKAEKLYKRVNTFILTCVGTDGYPLTKAVLPGKHRESLEELYFCTNTSSKFVVEISKNAKASIYFYSRKLAWKGCLLKGDMEIVTDMNIKEKYWQNKSKTSLIFAYPRHISQFIGCIFTL